MTFVHLVVPPIELNTVTSVLFVIYLGYFLNTDGLLLTRPLLIDIGCFPWLFCMGKCFCRNQKLLGQKIICNCDTESWIAFQRECINLPFHEHVWEHMWETIKTYRWTWIFTNPIGEKLHSSVLFNLHFLAVSEK